MPWKTVTKKLRGKAKKNPASEFAPTQIDVTFDQEFFSMRTGNKIRGKTYDSMEEAIQELGEKVVQRVLQNGETAEVRVEIDTSEWED